MTGVEALCAEFDRRLAELGFELVGGGFIDRRYRGVLDGRQASAALSVYMDTGGPGRMTSGAATGYRLLLRIENGLSARWMTGASTPLLTRLGLTVIDSPVPGTPLRAHDPEWARRRLLSPPGREGLSALLAEAFLVEQRPGILEAQIQRIRAIDVPALPPLVRGLRTLAELSSQPPLPKPAGRRLTDHRGLMVGLLGVVVVGFFVGLGALFWWAVR